MLECKEITKAYGKKIAVDHVSMKLDPGHIYAMLGPNGGGKTTLMKMAVGLVKPNSGEFTYQGAPVGKESRRDIAYMSTEPYFYSWMSISDVGNYYRDFFSDFSMERYLFLLERMELAPDLKTKSLSSGMMAKLKIAVTMARKAKVYLLDEPLNGIDLLARDVILQSVIEECTPDAALVISSHLVDELESVVDKAIFIRDGRIALMGDVEEFRTQRGKSIADLYREIYGHAG